MRVSGISFLLFLAISLPFKAEAAKTIREVEADESHVVLIRTAIGYSTILEFGSKPISAVVGDQDAFKLEYVKNSITIKPLLPRSVSNLFVFTEYGRFTCTLRTVGASEVDYLVRITSPMQKPRPNLSAPPLADPGPPKEEVKTTMLGKRATWKGYSLKVLSSSRMTTSESRRPVTIYKFELYSKLRPYSFSAASLGARQGRRFIPIESIYLDALDLRPGYPPLEGLIALLNDDFRAKEPISFVFAVPGHRVEVVVSGSFQGHSSQKGKPSKGKENGNRTLPRKN